MLREMERRTERIKDEIKELENKIKLTNQSKAEKNEAEEPEA